MARQRIEESELGDRIDVRSHTVRELAERDAFDVAWVAGDFVSADQLPAVFTALHRALKPGGWALIGSLYGPDDSVSSVVARLRAAAAGGDAPGPTVTTGLLPGQPHNDGPQNGFPRQSSTLRRPPRSRHAGSSPAPTGGRPDAAQLMRNANV